MPKNSVKDIARRIADAVRRGVMGVSEYSRIVDELAVRQLKGGLA